MVDLFAGDGEARVAARSVLWSETPLGVAEEWPAHLRIVVDFCLQTELPMLIAWGNDLVQIYNDACCPILGDLHPAAMGQPARRAWSGHWDGLAPYYERVKSGGERARTELRLTALPDGSADEASLSLWFSPIRSPVGEVEGVLVTAVDQTAVVMGERRTEALTTLVLQALDRRASLDIGATAPHALVGAGAVPFSLVYLTDGASARLAGAAGLPHGSRLSPQRVDLRDPGYEDVWRLHGLAAGGHVVRADGPADASHPGAGQAGGACVGLVLPLTPSSYERPIGALITGAASERMIDRGFRAFASRTASVLAASLAASHSFEAVRRRAQALAGEVEMRSRFMAALSHELRTPLFAIIAHADMCREGSGGPLTTRQEMHIGRISKAVVDLLGQVDEILEFSRAEAGFASLSTEVTDLRQLVEEVAGLVEPLFRERGLDFEVRVARDLRPIRTDRAKVRRILLNLLSNAQKYTTAGSVHLVVSQGYDDSVTAAVTDTGPGIDFEQQRRIFEPFERLRRPDDPGGTGLGLTVARSLARLLGGEITLDSARGQGSRFSVRVPHLLHPEASAASSYAEA